MNITEARLTTVDWGIVAFLLWKNELPTRLDFTANNPLFLYFDDIDYKRLLRGFWQGDYIPACEMSQCFSLVKRMVRKDSVPPFDDIIYELAQIDDYREMYSREVTIGDMETLDFDIMRRLEEQEPINLETRLNV